MPAAARSTHPDPAHPPLGVEQWRRHPSYGTTPRLQLTNADGEPCSRLVVVAAHPDDESLGAAGLIAAASDAGLSVYVVLLTAGEASYTRPGTTRHALATLRLAEMENALARLAPENYLVFLGAPDRGVEEVEAQVARSLTGLLGDARHTLLVAPWRHDGQRDHDAAGRAAAVAAQQSGARLVEYPLRAWTHRSPDELPWDDVVCLPLSAQRQEQKAAAIRAHASQIRPPATEPAAAAALSPRVLAHFHTPFEHYVASPPPGWPLESSPDAPA